MTAALEFNPSEVSAKRDVVASRDWRRRIAFAAFLIVNVALFMRPVELLSPDQNLPIYEVLIITCLVLSLPEVIEQLRIRSLVATPINACVLGLLAAIVASHLSNQYFSGALQSGNEFARVVVYYLLVVAVVDSPRRLLKVMRWLGWMALALAVLAILGYYGAIDVPAVAPLQQISTDQWGEKQIVVRLRGPGIFNDPNDLCLVLVPGMALWLFRLKQRRRGRLLTGLVASVALCVFVYALWLSKSRGGFIVLLAAVIAFLVTRMGWRRMLPWSIVVLPLLVILFAGRQTDIDLTDREDTAQTRIQFWSEGLTMFRQYPLFGIGHGLFADHMDLVAHNSFVQCFTELGFVGGTMFLGAFYLALRGLHRSRIGQSRISGGELLLLRPYLMAMVAGYTAGMLSLSRGYVAPTYLMLGLSVVYLRLSASPAATEFHVNARLIGRLAILSLLFLVTTYVFVRLAVRWS